MTLVKINYFPPTSIMHNIHDIHDITKLVLVFYRYFCISIINVYLFTSTFTFVHKPKIDNVYVHDVTVFFGLTNPEIICHIHVLIT